jgi:hypothetical protein
VDPDREEKTPSTGAKAGGGPPMPSIRRHPPPWSVVIALIALLLTLARSLPSVQRWIWYEHMKARFGSLLAKPLPAARSWDWRELAPDLFLLAAVLDVSLPFLVIAFLSTMRPRREGSWILASRVMVIAIPISVLSGVVLLSSGYFAPIFLIALAIGALALRLSPA